jgi:uncharacterized tellurite resistance protein B-like protein
MFRRFMGLGADRSARRPADPAANPRIDRPTASDVRSASLAAESASTRAIVARLELLPADHARFLACYAYTLARAANADLNISEAEVGAIEELIRAVDGLTAEQAQLVAALARAQAGDIRGTDDFLVTREFVKVSTVEQRHALARACFAVGAADGSISAEESAVGNQIANELGLTSLEVSVIRSEFSDRMAAIQELRRRVAGA